MKNKEEKLIKLELKFHGRNKIQLKQQIDELKELFGEDEEFNKLVTNLIEVYKACHAESVKSYNLYLEK